MSAAVSDFTTFAARLPGATELRMHSSRRKLPQINVKGICGEKNGVKAFILPVTAIMVKFLTANDILERERNRVGAVYQPSVDLPGSEDRFDDVTGFIRRGEMCLHRRDQSSGFESQSEVGIFALDGGWVAELNGGAGLQVVRQRHDVRIVHFWLVSEEDDFRTDLWNDTSGLSWFAIPILLREPRRRSSTSKLS